MKRRFVLYRRKLGGMSRRRHGNSKTGMESGDCCRASHVGGCAFKNVLVARWSISNAFPTVGPFMQSCLGVVWGKASTQQPLCVQTLLQATQRARSQGGSRSQPGD